MLLQADTYIQVRTPYTSDDATYKYSMLSVSLSEQDCEDEPSSYAHLWCPVGGFFAPELTST